MMPEYLVEELVEGEVVVAHEVVAEGPKRAAMAATGREIGFRNGQDDWIRVVDVARGSSHAFGYAGTDRRSIIDRQIVEAAKERREREGLAARAKE